MSDHQATPGAGKGDADDYAGSCHRCGSSRWVSVSLNGGYTRVPQCVPCGALHHAQLGARA